VLHPVLPGAASYHDLDEFDGVVARKFRRERTFAFEPDEPRLALEREIEVIRWFIQVVKENRLTHGCLLREAPSARNERYRFPSEKESVVKPVSGFRLPPQMAIP
jgi:hypothetical protein